MISVNSVSGGRTSAYMAVHHPTDLNVFACVLTTQSEIAPKDKGLLRECIDRLPTFIASRELDATLKAVLDLEQLLGKPIHWVSGVTYDALIESHQLPNPNLRICTQYLKVEPINQWLYDNHYVNEPFMYQIGYRADESRNTPTCDYFKVQVGVSKNGKRKRWKNLEFRALHYPLIHAGITTKEVMQWVNSTNLVFPNISNCDFCFFHTKSEMLNQAIQFPERAKWWLGKEEEKGHTFSGKPTYRSYCECVE